MSAEDEHRFLVLDGMRGVAAVAVLIGHATTSGVALMSYAAVDLFFMLSGFVLAHAYGDRIASSGGRRAFVIARFARLWPLYFLGSAIGLLSAIPMTMLGVWFWTPTVLAGSILSAPFFLPLPLEWSFPLNGPAWSLSYELLANAVFLCIGLRPRVALAISLASAPMFLVVIKFWNDSELPTVWGNVLGNVPRVLFSYFLGVFAYHLWQRRLLPAISAPAVLLFAIMACLYLYTPEHHRRHYFVILVFLVQPVLIWIGANSQVRGGWARLCAWLGFVSYGTYILHEPIFLLFELVVRAAFLNMDTTLRAQWYSVFFVLPATVALAHYATKHWDGPARAWIRTRLETLLAAFQATLVRGA